LGGGGRWAVETNGLMREGGNTRLMSSPPCAHAAGERARLLTARAAGERTFGENHSPGESRDEGVMKGEGRAVGEVGC